MDSSQNSSDFSLPSADISQIRNQYIAAHYFTLPSEVTALMLSVTVLLPGSFQAETLPLFWDKKTTPNICISMIGENSNIA